MFDWDPKVGWPVVISVIALLISAASLTVAWVSASRVLPNPRFETVFEAYDSREFSRGRLLWYWAISVTNVGGRTLSVDTLATDTKGPLVILAKQYQLQETNAQRLTHN
jgi:hypothetical protein